MLHLTVFIVGLYGNYVQYKSHNNRSNVFLPRFRTQNMIRVTVKDSVSVILCCYVRYFLKIYSEK